MACQNIKTLKINPGKGLLQKKLSGYVQFRYDIKQKKNVKKGKVKRGQMIKIVGHKRVRDHDSP